MPGRSLPVSRFQAEPRSANHSHMRRLAATSQHRKVRDINRGDSLSSGRCQWLRHRPQGPSRSSLRQPRTPGPGGQSRHSRGRDARTEMSDLTATLQRCISQPSEDAPGSLEPARFCLLMIRAGSCSPSSPPDGIRGRGFHQRRTPPGKPVATKRCDQGNTDRLIRVDTSPAPQTPRPRLPNPHPPRAGTPARNTTASTGSVGCDRGRRPPSTSARYAATPTPRTPVSPPRYARRRPRTARRTTIELRSGPSFASACQHGQLNRHRGQPPTLECHMRMLPCFRRAGCSIAAR